MLVTSLYGIPLDTRIGRKNYLVEWPGLSTARFPCRGEMPLPGSLLVAGIIGRQLFFLAQIQTRESHRMQVLPT